MPSRKDDDKPQAQGGPGYLLPGRRSRRKRRVKKALSNFIQTLEIKRMAKRQIINLPSQPHFVTFSTYQRRRFLAPVRTRGIVLEALQSSLTNHSAQCHGFVVMPNHVHAIISVDPSSDISSFLHAWKKTSSYRIKRFYAQELTKYHDMCPMDSPIWQANFYDFNLETDEKLAQKLDYMHNNPVVEKLVPISIDWAWSSARFYELGEEGIVAITPCR